MLYTQYFLMKKLIYYINSAILQILFCYLKIEKTKIVLIFYNNLKLIHIWFLIIHLQNFLNK